MRRAEDTLKGLKYRFGLLDSLFHSKGRKRAHTDLLQLLLDVLFGLWEAIHPFSQRIVDGAMKELRTNTLSTLLDAGAGADTLLWMIKLASAAGNRIVVKG